MEVKVNNINDIEEFCKLYKINIPVESEFDYYIETLKKSIEFSNSLDTLMQDYRDLESFVSVNGYSSVRSYKSQKVDELVDYIKSTQAYSKLMLATMSSVKTPSRDHLNIIEDGQALVSLDFRSANYNVLKTFVLDDSDELGKDWLDLCSRFHIHKALVNSKTFRQIIFGNTAPGRLQTLQKENMMKVKEFLQSTYEYTEGDFVFISHDEVILKVKKAFAVNRLSENVSKISEVANNMPIRISSFSLTKIKKNTFIKTVYTVQSTEAISGGAKGYIDANVRRYYFEPVYRTLHGVPGNKYYMEFKKYILNEDWEDRDLMYLNDGQLCTWVTEVSKKRKLPHYEMLPSSISMKEAASEYSYLWDNMTEILPDMSNEEKRRVIEIVAGACHHCFKSGPGCQCWNDE